ncbi:hypothetical protein HPC38_09450 [Pasteurellaceae bacterium HPA106]|uniref:hypothetical protein n=1 Tax=Spirabiliibacterium pneumoniae TaxID=221400 RepID=UPI001AAD8B42|nr:hypothetical protein [Spirabiliibacterium pneumoniae]MBE2897094.1 hypothetical protein [Spirabiliibacterium pneumoniae]
MPKNGHTTTDTTKTIQHCVTNSTKKTTHTDPADHAKAHTARASAFSACVTVA